MRKLQLEVVGEEMRGGESCLFGGLINFWYGRGLGILGAGEMGRFFCFRIKYVDWDCAILGLGSLSIWSEYGSVEIRLFLFWQR